MLVKAYWQDRRGDKVVKYAPGDVIPDDHPKRDWILRSGIAIEEKPESAKAARSEKSEEHEEETVEYSSSDETPVKEAAEKPKPTDSVDAHRAYLKARKIDPKGMTRAQMIKAIAGLDD